MSQFHELSENYLRETDLAYRKSLGQYFTPRNLREQLLNQLPELNAPRILDPACGSGEFLLSAREKYPDAELFGWEIDPKLARLSHRLVPDATVKKTDALLHRGEPGFDLVIGNPPYFEFKPNVELKQRYQDVISGRANIFSMFIKLGLDLLKPSGFLAFVVPPSMNNGAYFRKLREYIIAHSNIEFLKILDSPQHFDSATQAVMLLVLRKGPNKRDHVFARNGVTIFSPEPDLLKQCFANKATLRELGFTARTGRVVWNQHKDELLKTATKDSVPLIRPFNITSDGLALDNMPDKPQYIRSPKYDTGPAIVVNRVTGSAGNGRLKAAVIPRGMKFLGENHVNVIVASDLSSRTAERRMKQICAVINSSETPKLIRLITGNTQISRTELECLLPFPRFI